jgi:hypothetical protein
MVFPRSRWRAKSASIGAVFDAGKQQLAKVAMRASLLNLLRVGHGA